MSDCKTSEYVTFEEFYKASEAIVKTRNVISDLAIRAQAFVADRELYAYPETEDEREQREPILKAISDIFESHKIHCPTIALFNNALNGVSDGPYRNDGDIFVNSHAYFYNQIRTFVTQYIYYYPFITEFVSQEFVSQDTGEVLNASTREPTEGDKDIYEELYKITTSSEIIYDVNPHVDLIRKEGDRWREFLEYGLSDIADIGRSETKKSNKEIDHAFLEAQLIKERGALWIKDLELRSPGELVASRKTESGAMPDQPQLVSRKDIERLSGVSYTRLYAASKGKKQDDGSISVGWGESTRKAGGSGGELWEYMKIRESLIKHFPQVMWPYGKLTKINY